MRHPSQPDDNGSPSPRNRTRGAIRTHLGRKRTGSRNLGTRHSSHAAVDGMTRMQQEHHFDRLMGQFQSALDTVTDKGAEAFDLALDVARDTLVNAGDITVEAAEQLRQFLRRDLLHRDHPAMTFRTGDVTTAGTLTCAGCGWTIQTTRTSVLPVCPQCGDTSYRKSD